MRIVLCQFGHETNTFSPGFSSFEDISAGGWITSEEIIGQSQRLPPVLKGSLQAAWEEGVQVEPIRSIEIAPGPPAKMQVVARALDQICSELKDKKDIDGMILSMHGSGTARGIENLECYTLRRIRGVVGKIPIMCPLDLHGNITNEIVNLSQGLFGIKCNPHTDFYSAGYLATKTLMKCIRNKAWPVSTFLPLPMLLSPLGTSTLHAPGKDIIEYIEKVKRDENIIDATFFHGFSGCDLPHSHASVLVMANGRRADETAKSFARYVWGLRDKFPLEGLTAKGAVQKAIGLWKGGVVIINELSDNPGSGAPGDGTHLLKALLKQNIKGSVMCGIVDGKSALKCHIAGIGANIDLKVGGRRDPFSQPINLTNCKVLGLSEGSVRFASPAYKGQSFEHGKTARIAYKNMEIILISNPKQTVDDQLLVITGANMADYRLIGIKSANHFRAFFEAIADGVVTADPPGIRCGDLRKMPFQKVSRPIFPLDEVEFEI